MKLAPCIVHNYAGISLKAGYCRSTAAGNTSYRRLFSLRVGSREVLPLMAQPPSSPTAAAYGNGYWDPDYVM